VFHCPLQPASPQVPFGAQYSSARHLKTCYLHIGTEKTGSTAIQDFLDDNVEVLKRRGIFLSERLEKANHRRFAAYFSQSFDEYHFLRGITDSASKARHFDGFEANLSTEFKSKLQDHNAAVITTEFLHSQINSVQEVQAIADFLQPLFDRVVVICYFRRQVDMATSLYSTALKVGETRDMETFMNQVTPDNHYYNFERIAEEWSSVFGRANCEFRVFPPSAPPSHEGRYDIRHDFLSILGLDLADPDFLFVDRRDNTALNAEIAPYYRWLNRLIPTGAGRQKKTRLLWLSRKINRGLKRVLLALKPRGSKIVYSNKAAVNERFSASNQRFFECYFDGKPLF